MKKIIIMLISIISFNQHVLADSPLTSIEISKAYQNVPIVIKASKAKGELTVELMKYLIDKRKPIAYKIALINKLSLYAIKKNKALSNVNITHKNNNGTIFHNYISEEFSYQSRYAPLYKADSDVLICLAYLYAFDSDKDAIVFGRKARIKSPTSYTVHIISALIEAQDIIEENLCLGYHLISYVRNNKELLRLHTDLNKKAINIIFEYMDLYKKKCAMTHTQDIHVKAKKTTNTLINKIIALKPKYPKKLAIIKEAKIQKDITYKTFSISFFYEKGLKKRHRHHRISDDDFEEDGIGLYIYFFKGDWTGSAEVNIISLGDLNCVIVIENDNNGLYQNIEKIIIAEREKLKQ